MYEPLSSPQPTQGGGYKPLSTGVETTSKYTPLSSQNPTSPKITPPAYFSGKGYGPANQYDVSGKPLAKVPLTIPQTYNTKEQKISVVSPERVATTFDPTVPQKITREMLTNGRMSEAMSTPIRVHMGATYNDELDHQIALELAGSNQIENLKIQPGRIGGVAAKSDTFENQLAKQVINGELSLTDAQLQLADSKGLRLPESKTTLREKIQNYALKNVSPGTLQGVDNLQKGIGNFLNDPGVIKTLGELQEDPLSLHGTGLNEALKAMNEAAARGIGDQEKAFVKFLELINRKYANGGNVKNSEIVGSGLEFLGSTANNLFTPISAIFAAMEKLPLAGSVAKLITPYFAYAGKGGQFLFEKYIDSLADLNIISKGTADNIRKGFGQVGALAGQIALGEGVAELGKEVLPSEIKARDFRDEFSRENPGTKSEIGKVKTNDINKAVKEHGREGAKEVFKKAIETSRVLDIKDITHPEIGKIELFGGKLADGSKKGFGLSKIQAEHPEVIPRLNELQNAKIVQRLPQRYILETQGDNPIRAIVDTQLGKEPKTFLSNAYLKNVPREGIEPPTPASSELRSANELPRPKDILSQIPNKSISTIGSEETQQGYQREIANMPESPEQILEARKRYEKIPKDLQPLVGESPAQFAERRIEMLKTERQNLNAKNSLAEEARKYKSAEEFVRNWERKTSNLGEEDYTGLARNPKSEGAKLHRAFMNYAQQPEIQKIYEQGGNDTRVLTDFYNQAMKGDIPKFDERVKNVLEQLKFAEAGKRVAIKDESGSVVEMRSEPSTFPHWIPERLRSKEIFNKVIDLFEKGKEPKPHTKEAEVYDLVQSEARKMDLGSSGEEKRGGSITLTTGIDPGLDKFLNEDVKPGMQGINSGVREFLRSAVHLLSPKTGVARKTLDLIFGMKGRRDKAEAILDLATKKIEDSFDKMSQDDQVAFIDRIKRGERQPSAELQSVADFMRKTEDATYSEVTKYKPTASWKENHYRVLWKTIPGSLEKGFAGIFRRPLQGSKGFLKHATLADMSEGLAKGGVPYSYNPMTMFKNAYGDMMKFVTAHEMWNAFKEQGLRKFVKTGASAPAGFVELNDYLARVYFPTEAGLVQAGKWYVEEGAGRLLNNFLSKDLIRSSSLGRGLMAVKNGTTMIELGLSLFHFTFETVETDSSAMAVGIREMYNIGLLQKNPAMLAKGIKDFLLSPFAAKSTFTYGRAFKETIKSGDAFLKTEAGQKFLRDVPKAKEYIDDFFNGGGKLRMPKDYEIQMEKAFMQNIASGNYIGATLRAAPAAAKMLMNPLFDHYIPALKMGMFVREFPLRLEEMENKIAQGKTTRNELARQTIDFIENRLGEMNFDSLFLNRTFKTGLQFFFRSITWKVGNVRAFSDAFYGEVKEIVDAFREGRAPQITPEAAWLLSLAIYTATIATIVMKITTGKTPQTTKDFIYPQVDPSDPHNRISLPTYARDAFSLIHSPLGYLKSSMQGEISRIIDVWQNRDFYGTEIYSSTDPFYMKALYGGLHLVPQPFSISSLGQKNLPGYAKVGGFLGFTKAPGYISKTPLELDIDALYQDRFGGGTQTKEQKTASDAKSEIRKAYVAGDSAKASELLKEAVAKGYIKAKGADNFIKESDIPGDVRAFARFDATDQRRLVEEMKLEDLKRYAWSLKPEVKAELSQLTEASRQFVDQVNHGTFKEPHWKRGEMVE